MSSPHYRRSGRGRRNRRELNSRINVTPLVDVMLVLLIVFMIAAPLLSVGVPLELPKTDAKSMPSDQEEITVFGERRRQNIFTRKRNHSG